ncbi:MAG: 4Fe-4S binding protein [Oscillospiraceae bacterium]|nr:4Fe-4S binding protein [Oscillospiraceae bacterium]
MIKNLLDLIVSHGDRGTVVPFTRINDLKRNMIDLKNGDYHTDWLNRMANYITNDKNKFMPPDLNFVPCSLISIIRSSPKVILGFNYNDKLIDCVVPPHYTDFHLNCDKIEHYICDYLSPLGFSVKGVHTLPQKMLAVHCGLGLYGRNNICYNNEFGSYMQIMSYVSDLPCDETNWFPLRRMEICENCGACVSSCPTGAIDPKRQLINSDKCITYKNESTGEFPEWIDKYAHNSIIGCTKCQDCCPANSINKNHVIMGVTFTEEETSEILSHRDNVSYTDSLTAKIEATGIPPECIPFLHRNLAMLLQRHNL